MVTICKRLAFWVLMAKLFAIFKRYSKLSSDSISFMKYNCIFLYTFEATCSWNTENYLHILCETKAKYNYLGVVLIPFISITITYQDHDMTHHLDIPILHYKYPGLYHFLGTPECYREVYSFHQNDKANFVRSYLFLFHLLFDPKLYNLLNVA